VYGYAGYLAVAATVVPALLMGEGLLRVGAQRFALISGVGPVGTVLLAWAMLDEVPTAIAMVGMVITVAASAAMAAGKAEAAKPPAVGMPRAA
jgi:drug/metabolite transporter (DMT)-like permease